MLNDFAPFNRTNNKWEEVTLPATAGVEGIGVVIATAKNVPTLKDGALEVKDWVIARPEARLKPIGSFATLCVCDSSQLMKARRTPPHLATLPPPRLPTLPRPHVTRDACRRGPPSPRRCRRS